MASDCIFCKIVRKEIQAEEVVRTDEALVFRDLAPKAPSHFLVIPTRHVESLSDFSLSASVEEIGALLVLASKVGREASGEGYRIVVNEGRAGGQTVFHLHLHVLAGRQMTWPPG